MLTDDMGTPLNGEYQIRFNIYGSETGTDSLWSSGYQTVQVDEGLFIYRLGSNVPIPDDLFAGSAIRYLGITVDPDPEIEPRTRFLAVPYAYHALRADTADWNGLTNVPAGFADGIDDVGEGSKWTVTDSVLYTNNFWGIARGGAGNVLYGDSAYTMVNLGVICTTGTAGSNYGYVTISGGRENTASDSYAAVGGGYNNSADSAGATVGGGSGNIASGYIATVSGGEINTASGEHSAVSGGRGNTASGGSATIGGGRYNTANGIQATIGGGRENTASNSYATVGGGWSNTASGYASTVAGGEDNSASYLYATVGGGYNNSADSAYATVGGGRRNTASGPSATIGGGRYNTASAYVAAVGGGYSNSADSAGATVGGGSGNIASGFTSTVAGGNYNIASGTAATVPGGQYNMASGHYSFAAGRRAKADSAGSYVWADITDADFTSSAVNGFHVRASGGVYMYTSSDLSTGAYLSSGSGTWSSVCDRTLKRNIREVDYRDMIEKVVTLPISQWSYKTQDESIEHVGPMAQDFHRLFGLGEDDKHLTSLDLAGISLAAIKGLYEMNQQQKAQLDRQAEEISSLKEDLLRLTLMVEGKADIE
ncbi:MAG: tail fiber domain-containing protein [Candidatus Zixiibacteriota bacterium]|nr:MAG: tail fiber domain-containing protein [candidate division Zixibacteria bacterium]